MRMTRREFLIAGTASGALSKPVLSLPGVIYGGAEGTPSEPVERSLTTTCRQCPGGCGLRVRVVDNRVVGIAGNPAHPVNRGGLCPRALAAVQTLYNPDRLTEAAVLAGPKGSGRYRPIGCSEAIRRLAAKLREVRETSGPHRVAVVINGDRGLNRLLWGRFLQGYGSNNLIDWSFPEGHEVYPAVWAMQGLKRAVGYDLERTRYVLSFASQWLDTHWSPAQASGAFAALRTSHGAVRPRIVHVEPRLSITGAKADEWIPIRPGTEGALALGLAHVLLSEGLYDRQFVEQLTHGFEDLVVEGTGERIGYRRLVLRDYAPSKVADITGVEEGTIFRLAREFATYKPALALGYDGSGISTQRCYDRMAIHSLNAMVGSIDVPGGVTHFQDVDLLSQPIPEPDEVARAALARPRIDQADPSTYPLADVVPAPHLLAERILADLPYPIDVLVLAGANPVFDSPYPERMKQALAKVPFVVSLSPWLDDSARWADLIIPDQHFLARWELDVSHTLTGEPTVSIGRPVIAGFSRTTASADLVLELARQMGERMASALPYKDAQAVVRAAYDTLYASGQGGPLGPVEEVGWTRLLERSGWGPPRETSADTFYGKIVESGGWSDPIYYHREWDRVFRSPPQRFAFHSVVIAERIRPRALEDDIRCLPHYEPVHETEPGDAFPLRLYVYPLAILAGLRDVNVPWLMDICGAIMCERWGSWVEINPVTARRLGIAEGDSVIVTSRRGKMQTRAKLFEGIMPDVVAMPWGLGHEGGGRWSDGVGQNPSKLVETHTDRLTSGPFWNATRVAMRKA
ncbi:MAG: molybdopterin-dependent oxidoreductase [Planctomycetes bacterium]|nr:molybdopterin-dependent oxidoreductase [Planctomycetota bacterium]